MRNVVLDPTAKSNAADKVALLFEKIARGMPPDGAEIRADFPEGKIPSDVMIRILREPKSQEGPRFERLGTNDRFGVFFVGGSNILDLLEGARSVSALLERVGYPTDEIADYLKDNRFAVAVIQGGEQVKPATWENVRAVLAAHPVADARKLGDEMEGAMADLKRYGALPWEMQMNEDPAKGPVLPAAYRDLRRRLRTTLNLNPLFAGDGFTRDPSGRVGVPELFGPNVPLADFPGGARVVTLPSP